MRGSERIVHALTARANARREVSFQFADLQCLQERHLDSYPSHRHSSLLCSQCVSACGKPTHLFGSTESHLCRQPLLNVDLTQRRLITVREQSHHNVIDGKRFLHINWLNEYF